MRLMILIGALISLGVIPSQNGGDTRTSQTRVLVRGRALGPDCVKEYPAYQFPTPFDCGRHGRVGIDWDNDGDQDILRYHGATNGRPGFAVVGDPQLESLWPAIADSQARQFSNGQAIPLPLGHWSGRDFIMMNNDKYPDFCRVLWDAVRVLDGRIACTLSNGQFTGVMNTVIYPESAVMDLGYEGKRLWLAANDDDIPDYCRTVGNGKAGNPLRVMCVLGIRTGNTVTFQPDTQCRPELQDNLVPIPDASEKGCGSQRSVTEPLIRLPFKAK